MNAAVHPSEATARAADFDRVIGEEPLGTLSPAEERISRHQQLARERWARTAAARSVLRAVLSDIGWERLLEDPTRGQVARELYATWAPTDRYEPIAETDYAVTGIYADLEAAMQAHGTPKFEEACAHLGLKMTQAAIAYVFSLHTEDAQVVEDEYRSERAAGREAARRGEALEPGE